MSDPSRLEQAIRQWLSHGGDCYETFKDIDREPVLTESEAHALCEFAQAAMANSDDRSGVSPLHRAVSLFQNVKSRKAFAVLRDLGLPTLRTFVRDGLHQNEINRSEMDLTVKVLAMYGQEEDVEPIAQYARKENDRAGYIWLAILEQFVKDHPGTQRMVDALRDPLPTGFLEIAYLDMVNRLSNDRVLEQHPFDTSDGHARLMARLEDRDPTHYSYAKSATAAIPFIAPGHRQSLLERALAHPDIQVRMEAAWSLTKLGDKTGTMQLKKLCLDPNTSLAARRYLAELGHSDWIPNAALVPNFQALAVMADWLSHPGEMGRPPDKVEIFDSRVLYWPPTNDKRRMWLVKYEYQQTDRWPAAAGIGMVGSVTWVLFGEATVEFSAEDMYGLHCAWELERRRDDRAPPKRTPQAGRLILAQHNQGF